MLGVKHRLFGVASVLSLLLCMASGALWLKGYTNRFWVQTSPPGAVYAFKIWDGEAMLYRIDAAPSRRRQVLLRFRLVLVFVASGLAGLVGTAGIARARKRPTGHCRSCGYDLRASEDRCPECGTPIPSPLSGNLSRTHA